MSSRSIRCRVSRPMSKRGRARRALRRRRRASGRHRARAGSGLPRTAPGTGPSPAAAPTGAGTAPPGPRHSRDIAGEARPRRRLRLRRRRSDDLAGELGDALAEDRARGAASLNADQLVDQQPRHQQHLDTVGRGDRRETARCRNAGRGNRRRGRRRETTSAALAALRYPSRPSLRAPSTRASAFRSSTCTVAGEAMRSARVSSTSIRSWLPSATRAMARRSRSREAARPHRAHPPPRSRPR